MTNDVSGEVELEQQDTHVARAEIGHARQLVDVNRMRSERREHAGAGRIVELA